MEGNVAIYGLVQLRDASGWATFVGASKFKAGYSAYSLAHTWQPACGFPPKVKAVLDPLELTLDRAFIEWEETLDSQKAPSTTDIMVNAVGLDGESVPIAVEGKRLEPFAKPIRAWVRDKEPTDPHLLDHAPTPTRQRRLDFLNETVGNLNLVRNEDVVELRSKAPG